MTVYLENFPKVLINTNYRNLDLFTPFFTINKIMLCISTIIHIFKKSQKFFNVVFKNI